jgi:1,4-dihydroxy-2-naphthoyl-CoA hydrolase
MPRLDNRITVDSVRGVLDGSFPGNLGIEPLEVEDDHTTGRIVVDDRHLHPGGFVHGGVWTALADTVAAWGTFRHLPDGHDFTTVELKLNVFAAGVEGDELIARAEPQHIGRRTQVWLVRITRDDKQVAVFTLTQMVLAPR